MIPYKDCSLVLTLNYNLNSKIKTFFYLLNIPVLSFNCFKNSLNISKESDYFIFQNNIFFFLFFLMYLNIKKNKSVT